MERNGGDWSSFIIARGERPTRPRPGGETMDLSVCGENKWSKTAPSQSSRPALPFLRLVSSSISGCCTHRLPLSAPRAWIRAWQFPLNYPHPLPPSLSPGPYHRRRVLNAPVAPRSLVAMLLQFHNPFPNISRARQTRFLYPLRLLRSIQHTRSSARST